MGKLVQTIGVNLAIIVLALFAQCRLIIVSALTILQSTSVTVLLINGGMVHIVVILFYSFSII